jgi:anti-sigma regulatory factor (Ser/Thr protein kinase)
MSFCSKASRLKLMRSVIKDAAELAGLDDEQIDEVILAVNEACMNIIQHSYHMQPDGQIDVEISADEQSLLFKVRDYAPAVDHANCRSRNLDEVRPGGLGVHFIQTLMDESGFLVQPEDGGNLFQMKKYIRQKVV